MNRLIPGFRQLRVRTGGATINLVCGGEGPPLLLLHGYPETHAMWHRIAPQLAREFSVVCPDLRGYGDSSKPKGLPDHSNYSKRAMAGDMVEVMDKLGFARFHLAGHDRGARVAHRLARDHGRRVMTLAVLDIVPTLKMYESTDMAFARAYYHWFFLIQRPPLPERLLAGQVPSYILGRLGGGKGGLGKFDARAMHEYVRVFRNPRAIHATCEDYRASAGIDLEHDRRDRGKKLKMPVLVLWGKRGVIEAMFNPLQDWREVAGNVTGQAIDCGHFLPEEAPVPVLRALRRFFRGNPGAPHRAT